MKKINHILFPTDFSETAQNAFVFALWFADQYQARMELLHVIYPEAEPLDFPVMVTQMTQRKVEAAGLAMKAFVDSGLTKAQAAHQLEHIPDIHSDIEIGLPAGLISELADREEVDLIIMGTQGEHSAMKRLFGSVTVNSIRKAPCPVLVIPEDARATALQKVVFATDLAEADPYHIWEVGKVLAPFGIVMRVVHVEHKASDRRPLNLEDLEQFFKDHSPALQISFHNIPGSNIVEDLGSFIDQWDADLLVMYKPARGFVKGLFHRSLTKRTAMHTKTPLLVLK